MFLALARTPLVSIAAAHGAATAGGAGVMAACDFAVASEDLRISFPEVRVEGWSPQLVSTVLRKKLRDADLLELFLLAEPIDAARARSMGLVYSVVPEATVQAEADRLAAGLILLGGPQAIRCTKRCSLAEFDAAEDNEAIHVALQHHLRSRGRRGGEGGPLPRSSRSVIRAGFEENLPPIAVSDDQKCRVGRALGEPHHSEICWWGYSHS